MTWCTQRSRALSAIVGVLCCAVGACSSDTHRAARPPHTSRTSATATRNVVTIAGNATLDGKSFSARFVGAVVVDHGLVTPCNAEIPAIDAGRFSVPVYGAAALAGCGRRGSRVVLWTYLGSRQVFATKPVNWSSADIADARVAFSSARPNGVVPPVLELNGGAYHADGGRVRAGARVEALIGSTVCGVASVRAGVFDGYILHVVGPESIRGCTRGAAITFRVDGARAKESLRNGGTAPHTFDLTIA